MDLFFGLSDELDMIARLLDPASLAHFAQVCTTFRTITNNITGVDLSSLYPLCDRAELKSTFGLSREEYRSLCDAIRNSCYRWFCSDDYMRSFAMKWVLPILLTQLGAQSDQSASDISALTLEVERSKSILHSLQQGGKAVNQATLTAATAAADAAADALASARAARNLELKSDQSGWKALAERLDRVRTKRERLENLNARRQAKLMERRAVLETWFEDENPLGKWLYDDLDDWIQSVADHTSKYPQEICPIIRKYLTAKALTAPTLNEVQRAIIDMEYHVSHGHYGGGQRATLAARVA